MRFNTGNPVGAAGSSDPRDLYDNAGIIDLLVNGLLGEYLGRLGVPLKSWRGIMQQVTDYLIAQGYESTYLVYGAGVIAQRQTQLVQRDGELYRVMSAGDVPLTLTGNWVADATKLQAVGDAALRQALALPTGAGMVGHGLKTVAQELIEHSQGIERLDVKIDNVVLSFPPENVAQPLMSRSSKVLSAGQGVVILGDSISAGAYFGNAYTQGWPYLLAKSINHHFGAMNLGAIPTDSLYNVAAIYNTNQIHAVTWVGDWGGRASYPTPYDVPLGNVGLAAGDAVNGKTVVSTSSGAYVEIVVPSINGIASVFYVGRPDGGKIEVSVNGLVQAELDTFLATKAYNKTRAIALADNGQGEVTIRLTKKDGSPTEIQSLIKYQKAAGDPFDHFSVMNVCNHSISGRQLAAMSEAGIIAATNCACLIVALGYNDRFAETDEVYYGNYLQRVEWVIRYANINKCLVVVNDFAWYWPKTSRVRTQLRRIAKETSGIYIPFPDKFYPDGTIPVNSTPASSELVNELRLFADNAHPSFKGNELIFAEVAKALGLHVRTKRDALLNDMPYPLKLQGTLKNKAGGVSSVSRTERGLLYSLGVTAAGGGAIAVGTTPLATVPSKFNPAPALRQSVNVNSISTAGVDAYTTTSEDGSVAATVVRVSEISTSYVVATK